ncbi:MAG: bifunctional transaldolase/phosoglucose isomerase [Chloroflexi bacterium]|nr:bifunctional transaldolase/phosoglucose isomerase [Chloroflexota bacterium]
MTTNPPVDVQQFGQSIWFDFIHRDALTGGELQRYIDEYGVLGVTSNPAIFQKAIGDSDAYDTAIMHLLDLDAADIYERLAIEDIQSALDLFRPVYERTGGQDGYVSLEVSPLIANDTATTISEAKRLFAAVNRPNLMIKIPATQAGIPAIEEAIAAGINVNVTLIFAVENYEQVARAYLRGLERRRAAGQDIRPIASVASFFVSRIDTLVDRLLDEQMRAAEGHDPDRAAACRALMGKAAIANAKLAYKLFMDIFRGDEFAALREAGARVQRPLWASTGVKNPAYPDTLYVDALIGADTVNTVPPATLKAFRDHGTAAPTLTDDLDAAPEVIDRLAEVGISFDDVTRQLQLDGVLAFTEAFEQLIAQVNAKRDVLMAGVIQKQQVAVGLYADAVQAALKSLEADRANARLWAHDGSLWKNQADVIAKIENRLGWLDVTRTIDLDRLKALQASVRGGSFSHVVLMGMGGSSLAPEVLYRSFGQQPGFPAFLMLDSTHPAAVRAVEQAIDLRYTLFIVASKSGTTVETAAFQKYFYERAGRNGGQFIAITDPGSPLEAEARRLNFRDLFVNPADIGGRYSALSYFGLVPAALMGLDLDRLWAEGRRMMTACGPTIPARHHPGLWLGAILAALGQQGRDKIFILGSPSTGTFGSWIEQLVAESTGKEGKGLLPVVGGTDAPEDYAADSLVINLRVDDDPASAGLDAATQALSDAGHPCVTYHLPDRYALAGEFFRWEYATAIAGKLLGINPFDEPNVTESKQATGRLLAFYQEHGSLPQIEPMRAEGTVELYADETIRQGLSNLCLQNGLNPADLTGLLAALLCAARPGEYFALLAYLPPTPETDARLEAIRRRLRQITRRAVTVGYGPRYLHSTGQLHKGGADSGLFIQITAGVGDDLPIPGQPYSFGVLHAAQAAGDLETLRGKDRRALRLHLNGDIPAGLNLLLQTVEMAAACKG